MGLFDRVKALAEQASETAQEAIKKTKETYEQEGAEGLGKALGQKTREAVHSVVDYAGDVSEAAQKTANKSALIYKDKQTAQGVTRAVLGAVGAGVKITEDATNKIKGITEKMREINSEKPEEPTVTTSQKKRP